VLETFELNTSAVLQHSIRFNPAIFVKNPAEPGIRGVAGKLSGFDSSAQVVL
jgi:hypothetical protein